jgi:hypothetical protein
MKKHFFLKRPPGYFYLLTALLLFAVTLPVYVNLVLDPYYIFRFNSNNVGFTPNERFNKVEYLLANPEKYNSFFLGSSRMGMFSPLTAQKYRPDLNFYNLSAYGGNANDALLMLRHLKENGVSIKEIVMGIDLFPFLMEQDQVTPAYRHHPAVVNESTPRFYFDYLFQPSLFHAYIKYEHGLLTLPKVEFDFENTGQYFLREKDALIKADHRAYIEKNFIPDTREPVDAAFVQRRFTDLAALKKWLDENEIRVHFFIHPHHIHELQVFKSSVYPAFKQRVETILGPLPDFTAYRDWHTNHAWYYEKKHYRPVVADEIIRLLLIHDTPGQTATIRTGKIDRL